MYFKFNNVVTLRWIALVIDSQVRFITCFWCTAEAVCMINSFLITAHASATTASRHGRFLITVAECITIAECGHPTIGLSACCRYCLCQNTSFLFGLYSPQTHMLTCKCYIIDFYFVKTFMCHTHTIKIFIKY